MKNTFLYRVTEDLFHNHGDELGNYCLVFPGRRPGLFFTRYLSSLTGKPMWRPEIRTISELVQDFSGIHLADHLTLVTMLYKNYQAVTRSEETLDEFFFWGETLLSDFDDIDKYMADAGKLFKNVQDLKEIEERFSYFSEEQLKVIYTFWDNVLNSRLSGEKEEFLGVWDKLFDVYTAFREELKSEGIGYEGMIYREVAENSERHTLGAEEFSKFVITGFSGLNNCEKAIFKQLQKENRILFYWDYDSWYLEKKDHEAGFFLRENLKLFPPAITCDKSMTDKPEKKNFHFISVPSDTGQAKLIPDLLGKFSIEPDPLNTAIVLCDEKLLIPVLYSLPDEISDVNVTMGYPVMASPVFSLAELLGELQKTILVRGDKVLYYHKHVMSVLNHQYFAGENTRELANNIIGGNKIYISSEELAKDQLLSLVFPGKPPASVTGYLTEITGALLMKATEGDVREDEDEDERNRGEEHQTYKLLQSEIIYQVHTAFKRLNDLVNQLQADLSPDTVMKLVRKILQTLSISFTGEPLKGLQVMGVLETRVLDFENIILLSVNEGVFPKKSVPLSYIPYNLRKGFDLQTIEHQDSIFAYYFYRLLHGAKNIYLLYNSNEKGIRTGEMSRFMYQLKYESPFQINYSHLAPEIIPPTGKEISIIKTREIMQKLGAFTREGGSRYLSPTSFTSYLKCPLKFYFGYVEKLEETDVITEEADNRVLGEVLHRVMDELYRPYQNQVLEKEHINVLLASRELLDAKISASLNEITGSREGIPVSGVNLIVKKVIQKFITDILKQDLVQAPVIIEQIEGKYETFLNIDQQKDVFARVGGKIDRVDKLNYTTRVLDYKSGNDKVRFKSLEWMFNEDKVKSSEHVFQVFMYAFLYKNANPSQNVITPGIYYVRQLYKDNYEEKIRDQAEKKIIENYNDYHDDFTKKLTGLCIEIFNPELRFYQTEDRETCKYCSFKRICHRD